VQRVSIRQKLTRIKDELVDLARETEPEREVMRRHYDEHPPIPAPPNVWSSSDVIERRSVRYSLTDDDVCVLRRYVLAHRCDKVAKIYRDTGICPQTLHKYAGDLFVR
jgi:hypothetical protein